MQGETPLQASATGMTARASASELEEKVEIVFRYACGQPLGERKADLPRMSQSGFLQFLAAASVTHPKVSFEQFAALFGRVLTAAAPAAKLGGSAGPQEFHALTGLSALQGGAGRDGEAVVPTPHDERPL